MASRWHSVFLLLLLAGCKTWQPSIVGLDRLLLEDHPPAVRVTTSAGAVLTLRDPILVNDSLVTTRGTLASTGSPLPRQGVPQNNVRAVEVARFSAGRTIALAAAIVATSVTWATSVGGSEGGSTDVPDPLPKGPAFYLWGSFQVLLGRGR